MFEGESMKQKSNILYFFIIVFLIPFSLFSQGTMTEGTITVRNHTIHDLELTLYDGLRLLTNTLPAGGDPIIFKYNTRLLIPLKIIVAYHNKPVFVGSDKHPLLQDTWDILGSIEEEESGVIAKRNDGESEKRSIKIKRRRPPSS